MQKSKTLLMILNSQINYHKNIRRILFKAFFIKTISHHARRNVKPAKCEQYEYDIKFRLRGIQLDVS